MVIARDQITLSWQLDVQGTVYYYKKQSSTATAPEKPTSYPPTGWTTTEPGYSSGETSTLYVTVCTLYDNGSFEYSDVSVSASFEAAKEAYNKAVAAQTAASNAITAANGKTKIFYQNDAPTAGMAVGDMWFDTDGGNAVYQYTATGWVLRQFGNGSIAAGSITALEINVATLSAITANIGTVTAGVLQSVDYQPPTSATTPYSAAGMIIDLNNKNIRMPNTAILSDGSLYTKSGEIGGFTIDGTRLYSPVTIGTKTYRANIQSMGNETDPARLAFYVAIDENGSSTYPFRVNYAGTLFTSDVQATGGKIGPWTISISAIYNGKTALEYDNGSGVYIGSDGIGTSDGTYGNLSLSANGTLTLKNISADRNYAKISIQGGPGSETNPSKTEISYTGLYVKNKTYSFSQLDLGQNNTTGGYVDVTGFRMNTGIHMRGDNYGVGYPVISLLAHGDTSSYTATNGGLIEFCFNSSSATSKIQETSAGVLTMTASLNLTGNLVATTGIGVNKTTQQEAKAGFWANSAGNLYLTGDTNTGSYIYFYYNKATSATSYIREESSNHLYTNAYFRPKLYNGTVGQVVGSVPTDGNQIAYFSSNSTTLFINGQHGTTGSTFANKSIAFSTSDIRLKTNIEDAGIEALPIVNRMKVRAFDWKDGRKDIHQSIGVVADELEEIDRRLSVGGGYAEDGSINYKSVDTLYLCGYLLKAIQELSAEVKALKGVA